MRRIKVTIGVITLLLGIGNSVEAGPARRSYQMACEAELLNGGKPLELKARSKAFIPSEGKPVGSEANVQLRVGPYTLLATLPQVVEPSAADIPVTPPSNPTLSMNVFEGNPITQSIFLANVEGFRWSEFKRPLVLSGYQFRRFKHDGVEYTRMNYRCELAPVAE